MKDIISRRLMHLMKQSSRSKFFYFRISWILMEQHCFYFILPLHFVQGLRRLEHWLLQKLSMKTFTRNLDSLLKYRYFDALVVWCPTWSKNLGRSLLLGPAQSGGMKKIKTKLLKIVIIINCHGCDFRDINNIVMEMLIMSYACKTSSAGKIVGVIPFLPYSRQCKNNWI